MDNHIGKLNEDLEFLRTMQTATGGGFGLGVKKSRDIDVSQELSIDAIELEEQIALAKQKLLTIETQIYQAAKFLPSGQRNIIIYRYIIRLPWRDIAKKLNISEMQANREHNAALRFLKAQCHCCADTQLA